MRGIEGALAVLAEVERGAFAAESLRKLWPEIVPTERKLAATLAYCALRRMGLWRHLLARYCRRPAESLGQTTAAVLTAGIAGVLELEHFKPGVLVNALVQTVKRETPADVPLVNAVLHTIMDEAPAYIERLRSSAAMRDQALAAGVPGWVAATWGREWGTMETKRLLTLVSAETYMTARLSPGVDRDEWMKGCQEYLPSPSKISSSAVLLGSNPYPPDLPGYAEGLVTPQGESSIWAVESMLIHWQAGLLLDMCMGRGVKAGQVLSCCPDAVIEGWDLSAGRLSSAVKEFGRIGVGGRAVTACGDAASLVPSNSPSAIMLDAPCSGSGTWGRHPEGKWRMNPEKLSRMAELQKRLFARAADILPPGGVVMYSTCSIFREENENVVGSVLASRQDLVELPIRLREAAQKRGRPYGVVIFPESPWLDGFYVAIFRKKR